MKEQILQCLMAYVSGEIDMRALDDAVIPLLWELDDNDHDAHDLIDRVAAEMGMVKDDALDEATFRARMREIASRSLAAAG